MLTDRQQKFCLVMQKLSTASGQSSAEEKKYLNIALREIKGGKNFSESINRLNLALKALDFGRIQEGGLTPGVKQLFEELKTVYGEPATHDIYAENLSKLSKTNWFGKPSTVSALIFLAVLIAVIYMASRGYLR